MPDVNVTLRNKTISVDKSSVQVSVSKGEQVQWKSTDGAFEIVFKPGSNWPNPPAAHQVSGVWQTQSGPFNKPNTKLQYNVTASGYDTLDPDVDIIP
jgi:hypothetical protein